MPRMFSVEADAKIMESYIAAEVRVMILVRSPAPATVMHIMRQ